MIGLSLSPVLLSRLMLPTSTDVINETRLIIKLVVIQHKILFVILVGVAIT